MTRSKLTSNMNCVELRSLDSSDFYLNTEQNQKICSQHYVQMNLVADYANTKSNEISSAYKIKAKYKQIERDS